MEWNYKTIIYQPIVIKQLSILLIGFILGILLYSFVTFNESQTTTEFYLSGALGVLVCYSVYYSNNKLNQILPFRRLPGLRILLGVFWNLVLSLSIVLVGFWGYSVLMEHEFSFQEESNIIVKISILLFCSAVLYNVIYFALYAYNYFAKVQVKELELQRKQAEIQLKALKSQLRPHFLFNSLNVLSSLFHKDIKLAESFIRALGKSYDYTLKNYTSTLVTVEEELDFVKAYLLLIRTRFGNSFDVKIDIDSETQKSLIPPLTIQLLVENASKHNFFDVNTPLEVRVYKEKDELVVSNLKIANTSAITSTKFGLKNISSRYSILTGKKIKVINTDKFTVKLPILK
jgi:sensor histidine kinase YesM